jgi:membrane protein implicated in regulation of membrane protease activity
VSVRVASAAAAAAVVVAVASAAAVAAAAVAVAATAAAAAAAVVVATAVVVAAVVVATAAAAAAGEPRRVKLSSETLRPREHEMMRRASSEARLSSFGPREPSGPTGGSSALGALSRVGSG